MSAHIKDFCFTLSIIVRTAMASYTAIRTNPSFKPDGTLPSRRRFNCYFIRDIQPSLMHKPKVQPSITQILGGLKVMTFFLNYN